MDRSVEVGAWASFGKGHPLVPHLMDRMTMPNPEYKKAKRLGFPTEKENPDTGEVEAIHEETLYLYEEDYYKVRFPRALLHDAPEDVEFRDFRVWNPVEIPSLITLRPHQESFVEDLDKAVAGSLGATGQAEAGFGKTVCALEVMSRRAQRTVILVHKEFLMTQWITRILGTEQAAEFLGVEQKMLEDEDGPQSPMLDVGPEDIGIVQQDRQDWEGKKIVVAMVQSLTAPTRTYPEEFYRYFGLVVVDEVHRFAAPMFRESIVKFPAAMRLGVTATPERKDGLEDVFFAHIGGIAAEGKSVRVKPKVHRIKTPVRVTKEGRRQASRYAGRDKKGKPKYRENYVKVMSFLVEYEARNRQILKLLLKAAKAGRKIIVLSHRREHLDYLWAEFESLNQQHRLGVTTDFYVGGMDLKERSEAEKADVLFATYQMAEEGLDIPALDTAFLATPIGEVEQAVGRILRVYDDKMTPMVVDFVDEAFGITKGLAKKRKREYQDKNWMN